MPVIGVNVLDCILIATLLFFSSVDIVHGNPAFDNTASDYVPTISVPRKGRMKMAIPGGGQLIAGSRTKLELHDDGVGINVCKGTVRIEVEGKFRQGLHVKLDRGVARPHENSIFVVAYSKSRKMRVLFVISGAVTVSDGSTTKLVSAGHKAAWFKTRLVKRSYGNKVKKRWWASSGAVAAQNLPITVNTECVDEPVKTIRRVKKAASNKKVKNESALDRLNTAIKTVNAVSARAEKKRKVAAKTYKSRRQSGQRPIGNDKNKTSSLTIHLAWALPLSFGTMGLFFVYGSLVRERVSEALNNFLSTAGVFGVCSVCEGASISEILFSMPLNIDREQRHKRLSSVLPPELKKQLLKDIDAEAAARRLLGDYECTIEVCHNHCTQCGHAETLLQAGMRVLANLGAEVSRSASGDLTMSYKPALVQPAASGDLVARWDTLAQDSLVSLSRLDAYNVAIDQTNPGMTNTQIESMSSKRAGQISLRSAVAAGVASQKCTRTERLEDLADGLDLSMLPSGMPA